MLQLPTLEPASWASHILFLKSLPREGRATKNTSGIYCIHRTWHIPRGSSLGMRSHALTRSWYEPPHCRHGSSRVPARLPDAPSLGCHSTRGLTPTWRALPEGSPASQSEGQGAGGRTWIPAFSFWHRVSPPLRGKKACYTLSFVWKTTIKVTFSILKKKDC